MHSNGYDLSLLTYTQLQNLLRIEFARARRYGYPLACLTLQVDRLDHLRDLYGVAAKREILESVVKLVQGQTRTSDAVASYADRVTLLLPHTDNEGANIIGARLMQKAGELAFRAGDRELAITVSVGIATFSERGSIFYDSVLKNAEQALARIVAAGGNGVESFHQPAGDGAPA